MGVNEKHLTQVRVVKEAQVKIIKDYEREKIVRSRKWKNKINVYSELIDEEKYDYMYDYMIEIE